jgi:hypothetical protein
MLNVMVRDVEAQPGFMPSAGIAVPGPGDASGAHVQLKRPGGFRLGLDTAESARLRRAGWRADRASATVVLGFVRPTWQAVDDRHAELTSAGYPGRQPPSGAFWGARYAIVAGPDGHDVGLMSPVEDSRRMWPPQQSLHPGAGQRAAACRRTDTAAGAAPRRARM